MAISTYLIIKLVRDMLVHKQMLFTMQPLACDVPKIVLSKLCMMAGR